MKFLISVLLLFFGVTNFMAQDINCSTTPNFSIKQVEEIKSNILNNTDGNETSRFEDSKSLYCYSKINNDKNLLAFACNQLGLYYYQKRVKEKSFEYLREAEIILKENASGDLYRDNLNYLGLLYNFAGQHSMGINYLNKFHQYCLDYSSNKKIADAKNDLGLIYIEVGEYKLAKDYLEQALDTLLKIKDVFGAGYSALNLGRNEFINNNKF